VPNDARGRQSGFSTDVITVRSKGEIDATIGTSGPCNALPTSFTITGGTGMFAGASGLERQAMVAHSRFRHLLEDRPASVIHFVKNR
jgi:hypothetical protein